MDDEVIDGTELVDWTGNLISLAAELMAENETLKALCASWETKYREAVLTDLANQGQQAEEIVRLRKLIEESR